MGPPNEGDREEGTNVYNPDYSFCPRKIVRKLQVPSVQSTVFFRLEVSLKYKFFCIGWAVSSRRFYSFFHTVRLVEFNPQLRFFSHDMV